LGAFSEQLTAVKNDEYRGFKFKAVSVADKQTQKALH